MGVVRIARSWLAPNACDLSVHERQLGITSGNSRGRYCINYRGAWPSDERLLDMHERYKPKAPKVEAKVVMPEPDPPVASDTIPVVTGVPVWDAGLHDDTAMSPRLEWGPGPVM